MNELHKNVIVIFQDKKNNYWFGSWEDGLYRYDGKDTKHYSVKTGGKDITLFSIYKDNNGDLWIGTHENGAFKFKGTEFMPFHL